MASPPCRFGLLVRPVRALRQHARAHPVLPSEQRLERGLPGPNQNGREHELAQLIAEQHALMGPVVLRGVARARAALTGRVSVYLHGPAAAREQGRVGDDWLVAQRIGTLAIGNNSGWNQQRGWPAHQPDRRLHPASPLR